MQQTVYTGSYQEMRAYYRIKEELFTLHKINHDDIMGMSLDQIVSAIRLCAIGVAHQSKFIIENLFGKITFDVIMTIVERCGREYGQALYELQYIMQEVPQVFQSHATARTMEIIREYMHDDRAMIAPVIAFALTHDPSINTTCFIIWNLTTIPDMNPVMRRCVASLFGQASYDTPFRTRCKDMSNNGVLLREFFPERIACEYATQDRPTYLWESLASE